MALSEGDKAYVAAYADIPTQSCGFYATVFGEPALSDGWLTFFDGSTLSVVTCPLGQGGALHTSLVAALRKIASARAARAIVLLGPIEHDALAAPPDDWAVSPVAGLPDHEDYVLVWDQRYGDANASPVGKSVAGGVEAITTHGRGPLSAAHITLMRDTIARSGDDVLARVANALLPTWLTLATDALRFDAWLDGVLHGWAVVDVASPALPILLGRFARDDATAGALLRAVIGYCAARGHTHLSLGHGGDARLAAECTKWGRSLRRASFQMRVLSRSGAPVAAHDLFWLTRMLT